MEWSLTLQTCETKDFKNAYNSMLNTYGMSEQIDKMENTFSRMTMVYSPNLATYNTLLNIYGQQGVIECILKVLKKLEQEEGVKWDSYTYNTLIYAYGNAEMLEEAMKLFMEMQKAGFVPDVITYNCLVSALKKAGQHKQAAREQCFCKLLKSMLKQKVYDKSMV